MKLKASTITMEYKVYLERLAIAFKNGVKFAQRTAQDSPVPPTRKYVSLDLEDYQ